MGTALLLPRDLDPVNNSTVGSCLQRLITPTIKMCGELQLGTSRLRLGEKLAFAKYGSNNPASPFFFSFFSFKSARNIEVLWFHTGLFMVRKTPKQS